MRRRKTGLNQKQMKFNGYASPKSAWNNTMQRAAKSISAGRLKDAVAHLEQALSLAEANSDPGRRAETHTLLGWLLEGLDELDKAIDHFKRAVAISSVAFGTESQAHAQSMHQLSEAVMFKGDFAQAESLALASYEITNKQAKTHCKMANYFLPTSLTLLARISFRKGDIEQARKWLEEYARNRGMCAELAMLDSDGFEQLFYNLDTPKETIKHIPARIATFAPQL